MRTNRKSNGRHASIETRDGRDNDLKGRSKATPKRIAPKQLRIIGGNLKRRTVRYNGDLQTRPMKDSVRENLFNILGTTIHNAFAWDLFAGTGILAVESLSRGAKHAVAIDLSRECSRLIRSEAEKLGVSERLDCLTGDTFKLAPTRLRFEKDQRRVILCCPPYRLWSSKCTELHQLLTVAMQSSAIGSIIVAEMDTKSSPEILPATDWDVREYGNTRLAIAEKMT